MGSKCFGRFRRWGLAGVSEGESYPCPCPVCPSLFPVCTWRQELSFGFLLYLPLCLPSHNEHVSLWTRSSVNASFHKSPWSWSLLQPHKVTNTPEEVRLGHSQGYAPSRSLRLWAGCQKGGAVPKEKSHNNSSCSAPARHSPNQIITLHTVAGLVCSEKIQVIRVPETLWCFPLLQLFPS